MWPSNTTSWCLFKRTESRISGHVCTSMFIKALCTAAKRQKQMSINRWMNKQKMSYIYTQWNIMKEILTHTTWMNPEDIMLSKRSQSQKDKSCMISLPWSIRVVKLTKTESRMEASTGQGPQRNGEFCLMGAVFPFCKMKIFWEVDCTITWINLTLMNYTLKNIKMAKQNKNKDACFGHLYSTLH